MYQKVLIRVNMKDNKKNKDRKGKHACCSVVQNRNLQPLTLTAAVSAKYKAALHCPRAVKPDIPAYRSD